eukprot:1154226-Pelagomonas_calceolata.AAC.1
MIFHCRQGASKAKVEFIFMKERRAVYPAFVWGWHMIFQAVVIYLRVLGTYTAAGMTSSGPWLVGRPGSEKVHLGACIEQVGLVPRFLRSFQQASAGQNLFVSINFKYAHAMLHHGDMMFTRILSSVWLSDEGRHMLPPPQACQAERLTQPKKCLSCVKRKGQSQSHNRLD